MAVTNLAQNALISGIAAIQVRGRGHQLDGDRRSTLAAIEPLPGRRDR